MTDEQGFDYTEEETAMAKSVIESMRMGSEMRFSVKRFDVSCPWPLADGTDCADDTEVLVVAWDNPKR
jgi:hypothetical protein